eukprot:1051939-Pyramimonas_sp.AAC.1
MVTTIQALNTKDDSMVQCSEEIALFVTSPDPGQGLNARLDATVVQARNLINAIPMDMGQIQSFVDDIADGVTLAVKGQTKDANAAWAD